MKHRRPSGRPSKGPKDSFDVTHLSAIEHIISFRPGMVHKIRFNPQLSGGRTQAIVDQAKVHHIPLIPDLSLGDKSKPESKEPAVRLSLKEFPYLDVPDLLNLPSEKPHRLIVALDHIQDPQNFGAICRSAEALGVHALVLPKDRSVSVTPAVFNASAGAAATLPIARVTNLGESLRRLKDEGFWIVGSSLAEGEDHLPWKMPDFENVVLVIGAEGEGMSPLITKLCDWLIQIPMLGKVQSLNANSAASILMYEITRRWLAAPDA